MLRKLPLKGYVYSAFALNLIAVILIVLAKNNLPPVAPLFYGKPIGSGQLVPTSALLFAPLVAVLITIVNILLASRTTDEFSKKIFSVASFFVSVLATITIIKIIFLVGFW